MTPVSIVVNRGTTFARIAPGFAGFSYEKSHLIDGFFRASNAPLINLFKLLGPGGLLRVGGNSGDRDDWVPDGGVDLNDAGAQKGISQANVDNLAAFAKAAEWQVLYLVNLKISTPEIAAEEASYAAAQLGSSLSGFEIGNEPDLYGSTVPNWDGGAYRAKWDSFAAAIRTAVPSAPLTGPASAGNYTTWTIPFAKDEKAQIDLVTQHYYRGNGQLDSSTLDLLLAPQPSLITELQALAKGTTDNAIPKRYRLAEANSFYNGGRDGVSDAYGTALWVLDFLFTNARYGSSGVNFHGGGNGNGYTPIGDADGGVVSARPEFYGMLLFSRAGAGTMYDTTVAGTTINFTAYSIGQADGSTNIVVVNKDATTSVHATVDVGQAVTSADVMRLEGPALEATSGVTFGGAGITSTGSWAPNAPAQLYAYGNTVTVDVPPASAALVRAK
ncbi:MAG TPA: glycosyl hydrolase family 79 C-terminal domain-containing protein [Polyangiaceae bacterium]|nr:glycosyl hydrolase family 79 C-terminal domain-containing protein [Polyangiaceae bacterium]